MYRYILKILLLVLFSFWPVYALDKSKLPPVVKQSIIKQYGKIDIKILSVKKNAGKFVIIVKTKEGKDKVVITKKGKILSISDYLEGMEPTGGC